MIEMLVIVGIVLILDIAALQWGVDSRELGVSTRSEVQRTETEVTR
jgi:hypothetical protein